jgi:hypothetical protein
VEQAVTIGQFEAMSRAEIAERLIAVRDAVPPGFAL